MKTIQGLLLVCIPTFLIGCSIETEKCSDVNQDRIYQYLNATYDQEEDTTSADAKFTFGGSSGTTLELVENCNVAHNSITLSKRTFLGTDYAGSSNGETLSHQFTFTDNQSRNYVNSGTITTTAFARVPSTLSKAGGQTVAFSGALASNESMTLQITQETVEDGTTTTRIVSCSEDDDGATAVTTTSSCLETLNTGTATMELRRIYSTDLSEGTEVGGQIYMRYYTSHATVTITE